MNLTEYTWGVIGWHLNFGLFHFLYIKIVLPLNYLVFVVLSSYHAVRFISAVVYFFKGFYVTEKMFLYIIRKLTPYKKTTNKLTQKLK